MLTPKQVRDKWRPQLTDGPAELTNFEARWRDFVADYLDAIDGDHDKYIVWPVSASCGILLCFVGLPGWSTRPTGPHGTREPNVFLSPSLFDSGNAMFCEEVACDLAEALNMGRERRLQREAQ